MVAVDTAGKIIAGVVVGMLGANIGLTALVYTDQGGAAPVRDDEAQSSVWFASGLMSSTLINSYEGRYERVWDWTETTTHVQLANIGPQAETVWMLHYIFPADPSFRPGPSDVDQWCLASAELPPAGVAAMKSDSICNGGARFVDPDLEWDALVEDGYHPPGTVPTRLGGYKGPYGENWEVTGPSGTDYWHLFVHSERHSTLRLWTESGRATVVPTAWVEAEKKDSPRAEFLLDWSRAVPFYALHEAPPDTEEIEDIPRAPREREPDPYLEDIDEARERAEETAEGEPGEEEVLSEDAGTSYEAPEPTPEPTPEEPSYTYDCDGDGTNDAYGADGCTPP